MGKRVDGWIEYLTSGNGCPYDSLIVRFGWAGLDWIGLDVCVT